MYWANVETISKGNRWRVFGVLVVWFLISMGLGFIGGFVTGFGGALAAPGSVDVLGHVVSLLVTGVTSAGNAAIVAVSYHDLRVAQEGVDTEQIAAVFD